MTDQKQATSESAGEAPATAAADDDRRERRKKIAHELFFLSLGLRRMCQTLDDVYSIGQIIKSDGCSDFREKRWGMNEVCSEVSHAIWRIGVIRPDLPEEDPKLDAVAAELEALLDFIKPIPESITDVMKNTDEADRKISEAAERLAPICDRFDLVKAAYEGAES